MRNPISKFLEMNENEWTKSEMYFCCLKSLGKIFMTILKLKLGYEKKGESLGEMNGGGVSKFKF